MCVYSFHCITVGAKTAEPKPPSIDVVASAKEIKMGALGAGLMPDQEVVDELGAQVKEMKEVGRARRAAAEVATDFTLYAMHRPNTTANLIFNRSMRRQTRRWSCSTSCLTASTSRSASA